ncbi:MAG: hypothetical protein U0176_13655 [Bacteroidia bacterium]
MSQATQQPKHRPVNLQSPRSFASSFRFPVQSQESRREVLIGALWLLFLPPVGWILNMGHRIMMVHNMQNGRPAWPAWTDYGALFKHGFLTFLGMVEYHAPSVVCGYFAWKHDIFALRILSIVLWIIATVAVPGYMSHYCKKLDPREIFDPMRAMRRVVEGGAAYWKAWGIVLCGMVLSFSGLLLLGIGFFYTSVWFWQSAGFSFACVFTQKFQLDGEAKA